MIFNLAEQGSEAWFAARKGKITGSKFKDARDRSDGLDEKQRVYVGAILSGKDEKEARVEAGYKAAPSSALVVEAIAGTLNKKWGCKAIGYAHDVARERVGGKPAEVYQNAAMRTGTEQEPFARQAYETVTGHLVQEVGFASTECGTYGLSLDGKVGYKGAVEIKTMVSSETLFSAVVDGDISEYEDQCNGAILFLDLDWIDLVLWTPDLEEQGLGLVIKRIERDEAKLAALKADLDAFAALVSEFEGQLRSKAVANIKALNQELVDQPESFPMPSEEITPEPALEILALPDISRCCEKAAAEGVVVCAECAEISAGYQSCMGPQAEAQPAVCEIVQTDPAPAMFLHGNLPVTQAQFDKTYPVKQKAPATPPTMALGEISTRLGFNVTSAFLASLGFEATTVKAAKLFQESDFLPICRALIEHIETVCEAQAA